MSQELPSNPTVALIQRVREEIINRFFRGELNYTRDTSVLKKHATLSQEMKEFALAGRIYNTLGLIDMELGHLGEAERYFHQGYALAEQAASPYVMSTTQNNLGELYRYRGEISEAIKVYRMARDIAHESGDTQAEAVAVLNMGLCATALKDYRTAYTYFGRTYDLIKAAPWDYVRLLIAQRLAVAEVHISRAEYDTAWILAAEAEDLALGRDFKQSLATVYLTKAHILGLNPDRQAEAREYYRKARQGLRDFGSSRALALALLEEARYQAQHEQLAETRRLAIEAKHLFEELEMAEYVVIAQNLVDSTPQTS